MSDESLDASLDLLRRLDPKKISENVTSLCQLSSDIAEDLLSSVDQPLAIKQDPKASKAFLICDYNRDGDSYRSPWTNSYIPRPTEGEDDCPFPSTNLRKLESHMNDSFDLYRESYYDGGLSSVYLWDLDESGNESAEYEKALVDYPFAGVVLIKKTLDSEKGGSWDSIHVFEVNPEGRGSASYKVTSTIILDLSSTTSATSLDLSGNLTRQTEKTLSVESTSSHIVNLGTMIEDIESKLRNMLQEVYFGKTRDIVGDLRSPVALSEVQEERSLHSKVIQNMSSS